MNHLTTYRGRFAPTPSGPLHLGSLLTALASYLDARARGGHWLLRMDDLDGPRCVPGAADRILRQLEAHGLHWDEAVRYQSQCTDEYTEALARLRRQGLVYACDCTRAVLKRDSLPGPDDPVYSRHCLHRAVGGGRAALRLRVDSGSVCFDDGRLGRQCRDAETGIGDFVLQRNDGQIAYQLACAVDESAQGITHVVRGADLLGSSFRQILVQRSLGLPSPSYRHLPILVDDEGRKLSKQNRASALDCAHALSNLHRCLALLGQTRATELPSRAPAQLLSSAVAHWNPAAIPQTATLKVHGAAQQTLAS